MYSIVCGFSNNDKLKYLTIRQLMFVGDLILYKIKSNFIRLDVVFSDKYLLFGQKNNTGKSKICYFRPGKQIPGTFMLKDGTVFSAKGLHVSDE